LLFFSKKASVFLLALSIIDWSERWESEPLSFQDWIDVRTIFPKAKHENVKMLLLLLVF